jgi:hypothetical protein
MLAKALQADFCSQGARERAFAPLSTSYFLGAGAEAHPLTLWPEGHNNGGALDDRPRPPESKPRPSRRQIPPGRVEWLRIAGDY